MLKTYATSKTKEGKRAISVIVFDAATALATGDGKAYVRIPSVMNGYK